MKIKVKNSIKVLIVLALTLLSLWGLATICERKDSKIKNYDFFNQQEPFDVLIYGTSHPMCAIFPMELYKDFGIVSYNLASDDNKIPTSYWVMRNSLEYTSKPKLIILDTYLADNTEKISRYYAHVALDSFKLNTQKIKAVADLCGIDNDVGKEFLYEFSSYHSRWQELTGGDFKIWPNLCKGAFYDVKTPNTQGLFKRSENGIAQGALPETAGTEYLKKFIEYCRENEIQLLLVKIPYADDGQYGGDDDYKYELETQKIANEYNVPYIRFSMDAPAELNFYTDLADVGHLNPSGARKLTEYLGQYIVDNYNIPDQRQNPEYAYWYENYQEYYNYKLSMLAQQNNLYNYLMLLYDSDFYSEIQIDSATRVDEQDGETAKLLENIKDFTDISYTEDLKYNDNKCDILIHVYDAKTHEELSTGAFNYAPVYDGNSAKIS